MSLSHFTRGFQPSSAPSTTINPADFVKTVDNPYFALQPGTAFFYENADGSAANEFVVTRRTKVIQGVTCVVVMDTATEDGELVEKTFDYFAQDIYGNVWYFGEDTKEFVDGKVVSTEGTWRAGVDGAQPGIIMKASPQVGDEYNQENAPGVAEDRAEVLSLDAPASAAYAAFLQTLQTLDTTPLDPGSVEHKFYAQGVGQVLTENVITGEIEQLVKIKIDGTLKNDTLVGKVGTDELIGHAGNDSLNGLAGSDTIHGGYGRDLLDGGNDLDADCLYGGAGKDTINIGTADRAFGGLGNDVLRLFDNSDFGSVDGGRQFCRSVARSTGDVLTFDGQLDLAAPGLSERITGIETLSMRNGSGGDSLKLSSLDVLDLGDGTFNPLFKGPDTFRNGDALRIDGESGDQLILTGGQWSEIDAQNAPKGYDVFAVQVPSGSAYILVQEDITVSLS
ncbi:MAG: calcium-binding protein [Dongiaceae bacterium]